MKQSEERTSRNGVDPLSSGYAAARRISEYLTLGMHHSTDEAKKEMAKIIDSTEQKFQQDSQNLAKEINEFLSHNVEVEHE
jgi:hypothetical protein